MATLTDFLLTIPDLRDLSQRSHILLVGYYLRRAGITHFSQIDLRDAFNEAGLQPPANLNIRLSQLAKRKKSPLLRIGKGRYSLSFFGVREIEEYLQAPTSRAPAIAAAGISAALNSLKTLVGKLANDAEQQFLAEAVACVEVGAKRAAVVMVWLLSMDHLCRYVLKHKLADFNASLATRSGLKIQAVSTKDDFSRIRDERTFIEILSSANIVSKDVRKILDQELGFRNSCAHPSDIFIPDGKVVAAVEDLVYNVVLKYPL